MFNPPPDYWQKFFPPPDDRKPWEWARDTVRLKNSPFGDRFLPDLTPWLKEPLEEIAKNENTEITCQCCVQGGKTVLMQMGAAYAIAFEPGPMMFNCQTDDDADDFAKERWATSLQSIPGIEARMPQDKARRSYNKLSLTDMFMLIQGANRQNLQSKSIRWLFNDEVFLWKSGLLDEARKRTTQYWNRRRVNGSTAGERDCDLDRAFEAGDKREWYLYCPSCSKLSLPQWARINYKDSGGRKEDGSWDYKIVKANTAYVCERCGARHLHTEETHKRMNAGAKYIPTNPNPTPGWISFRWNALCLSPSVCSWGDLAVEWLKAEAEFAKGNEAPRKEFIQKRLAESYDPNKYISFTKLPTVEIKGDWKPEKHRFMLVDVQEMEFWVLIVAYSADGDDLVMWAGKLFSWAEVEAKQAEYKVNGRCVGVDCGFDTRKVYEMAAKNGWTALRGEDRKEFAYSRKGKNYMLPYSWPPAKGDPLMGSRGEGMVATCAVIRWSNPTIKDIAKRRRDGQTKTKSMVAEGVIEDFSQHMFSEYRKSEIDKRGHETSRWYRIGKRPNHLWDCYCMGVTMACLAKIIGDRPDDESVA